MVRGLSYYTGPIWEIAAPGVPGSLAGGGRYDHLIEQLGGPDVPATGGALGIERILLMLPDDDGGRHRRLDVAVTVMDEAFAEKSSGWAALARAAGLRARVYLGAVGQARQAAQVGQRPGGPLVPDLRQRRGRGRHGHRARHGQRRADRSACRRTRAVTWPGWQRAERRRLMTTSNFIDPDIWFAQLPGVVLAAGALITDPAGRMLLVKPNYRDHWSVPGGICEHGEPPHAGCAREVAEEIGLEPGWRPLLAIDWSQPFGREARPIMHFLFDGGTLSGGAGIVLQRAELDEFRFTDPAEMAGYWRRTSGGCAPRCGRAARAAVYQPTAGELRARALALGRAALLRRPRSGRGERSSLVRDAPPLRAPSTSARWGWTASSASATVTGAAGLG